ncbi:MAG: DUF3343 domain-containing protein [Clostridia bacterium]|nr:DUF3343 domain-containing protein [Clostridia bacterium]
MTDISSSPSGGACVASIGSTTLAMKAQRALSAEAIASSVIKINSSRTRRGCAYGVSFDCSQRANVQTVLSRAGISVKEYL